MCKSNTRYGKQSKIIDETITNYYQIIAKLLIGKIGENSCQGILFIIGISGQHRCLLM